jgi:hypothetical protein
VDKIFKNPEYYSGYYLRQLEGNLMMMGDAPAEQNHSSVAAHLGNGSNWTISEHVRQLIERQNTLEKAFHYQDNKLYTSTLNYRSEHVGPGKKDEELAKKHLTKYAFNELFVRTRDKAKELKMEELVDGSVLLWPHYRARESERTVTLRPDERCECTDRRAYRYQCCHELAHDGHFDLGKYHPRWLMTRIFRHKFPVLCQMPTLPGSNTSVASNDVIIGSVAARTEIADTSVQGGILHDEESVQEGINEVSYRNKMNYVFALGRCSQLCKTAGHDKVALASVVSLIDEATERLRRGLHITPIYTDFASAGVLTERNNLMNNPLPSVPAHHTNPTGQRRFKSSLELKRGRKRRSSKSVTENDPTFMEPLSNTAKRTKTCRLCFQQGHQVTHCPSLDPYLGIPLPKDDREARSELAVNMSQPNTYTSSPLAQQTQVYKSLPTGVQALIIHKRVLIDSTLLNSIVPSNFCFLCTVLHEGGTEHETYTRAAFQLGCIAKFVTNSKANIVISELKLLSSGPAVLELTGGAILAGNNDSAYLPFLSQLSQQTGMMMTQPFYSQHLSQHLDDGPAEMGYGL